MLKYGKNIQFNPERFDPLNIDRQSIAAIPKGSNVLEIGCATGFAGEYLINKKNCIVTGVELGKEEAKIARKKLTKLIIGNIEDQKTIKKITHTYDVVYASALIEHLIDPWAALKSWRKFLKKDGKLILTTSNIAHWSMRIKLIKGNFDYQHYGILDNTHLRFFTYYSFKKLIEDCGYSIIEYRIDSVGGGFPKVSKPLSKMFPGIFAYQMLAIAQQK